MYIKFDTKFVLPSVMFTDLDHNISFIYKPTSPLLFPTQLHMTEQVFSSIQGVIELKYLGKDLNTCGLPFPRVIRSKTYRGYVKPRITPNAIYNVIFM